MKTHLYLAMLIALFTFAACKKDKGDDPKIVTKLLAKTISSAYLDTLLFDYNSSDQMTHVEDDEDRSTIEITGNQLHYIEFRKTENRQVADATFTLNAQGNIVSGQGSFSYNAAAPYTAQFTFEYDAAGNLVKRVSTNNTGNVRILEYTWTNGDITKIKWFEDGAIYITYDYQYHSDLDDKIKLDWDKFITGTNSFTGNSNKHLLKQRADTFAPSTTPGKQYSYTYSLDADGYPTTSTIKGLDNPFTNTITYFYK